MNDVPREAKIVCKYCGKSFLFTEARCYYEYCSKKCLVQDLGNKNANLYLTPDNTQRIVEEKIHSCLAENSSLGVQKAIVWSAAHGFTPPRQLIEEFAIVALRTYGSLKLESASLQPDSALEQSLFSGSEKVLMTFVECRTWRGVIYDFLKNKEKLSSLCQDIEIKHYVEMELLEGLRSQLKEELELCIDKNGYLNNRYPDIRNYSLAKTRGEKCDGGYFYWMECFEQTKSYFSLGYPQKIKELLEHASGEITKAEKKKIFDEARKRKIEGLKKKLEELKSKGDKDVFVLFSIISLVLGNVFWFLVYKSYIGLATFVGILFLLSLKLAYECFTDIKNRPEILKQIEILENEIQDLEKVPGEK